jgi:beta-phosphoglucomutase
MKWIHQFQLFLFDLDDLLVNTGYINYQSYVNTLARRGYLLDWSYAQFCELAHLNDSALRDALYVAFPGLDPDWGMFYTEKKKEYLELLLSGQVELMPGVDRLLGELNKARIRRCVVTNSPFEATRIIRSKLPALQTISHWITREDYENPKPDPEGYFRAIALYGQKGDQIIGFEDSIRGLRALQQTPALAVLICPSHYPLLEIASSAMHFESFEAIAPDQKFL